MDVNFPVIFWLPLSDVTRWYLCIDWKKISMIIANVVLVSPSFWILNSRVATCASHRLKTCYITHGAFIFENVWITTYVIWVILNCFARMLLSCPREFLCVKLRKRLSTMFLNIVKQVKLAFHHSGMCLFRSFKCYFDHLKPIVCWKLDEIKYTFFYFSRKSVSRFFPTSESYL